MIHDDIAHHILDAGLLRYHWGLFLATGGSHFFSPLDLSVVQLFSLPSLARLPLAGWWKTTECAAGSIVSLVFQR
jgi:hypothetical protein